MGRIYSKTGCVTCKQRKKKCNEGKPSCSSCMRLNLTCSYDPGESTYRVARNISLAELRRPLTAVELADTTEKANFDFIRESALSFYTPLCDAKIKDFSNLWQMAFDDRLVRNTLVACFSVIQGSRPHWGELNREVYGYALTTLRDRLEVDQLERSKKLPIQVTVNFLGLMDTSGPLDNIDPLRHFKALAALIAIIKPKDLDNLPAPERNVYLIILESLAYHVTAAMHSRNIESIYRLWRGSRVFQLLHQINPEGTERVSNSPLLSGQYMIYNLVLELTYLHRLSTRVFIATDKIDSIEITILTLRRSIVRDFQQDKIGCSTLYQRVFSDIYQLYIGSLLICINTLRNPTEQLEKDIDFLVSENLSNFINIPIIEMCYAAVVWPLQVLACATRHETDFQRAEPQIARIKALLDPGHKKRLETTLDLAKYLRQKSEPGNEQAQCSSRNFPLGLSLLRKEDGIFS